MPGVVSLPYLNTWWLSSIPFSADRRASPLQDFPHDHARSRTYRWGEDGIAGVCDTHGLQNIAFSFWNEKEYGGRPLPQRSG